MLGKWLYLHSILITKYSKGYSYVRRHKKRERENVYELVRSQKSQANVKKKTNKKKPFTYYSR